VNESINKNPALRFSRVLAVDPRVATACLVVVTAAAVLCGSGRYWAAAVLVAAATGAGLVAGRAVNLETLLIFWFATTPIASFYLRLPLNQSILTYDRCALLVAIVVVLVGNRMPAIVRPKRTRRDPAVAKARRPAEMTAARMPGTLHLSVTGFEITWALLSLTAITSAAIQSHNLGSAFRSAVDSFLLPLIAFHLALHCIDLGRGRARILVAAMALSFFLFGAGAIEYATRTNLFQYKGSSLMRAGELRVNGPYASDSSYAIICLLLFLFLWAAPRVLGGAMDSAAHLVYLGSLGAALAAVALPLFRSVALSLVLSLVIYQFLIHRSSARGRRLFNAPRVFSRHRARWFAAGLAAVMILAPALLVSSSYLSRRLTSSQNVYGRLATLQSAIEIALDHPLTGVGLDNYQAYFHAKYLAPEARRISIQDARASDSPHSNVLWIWAQLGAIGLVLYLVANLQLFGLSWRGLRRAVTPQGRAAAACCLGLFIAYSTAGLALASGGYSDLNLCFFFLSGVLLNLSRRRSDDAR
jgi:O-antigen ligase